MLCAEGANFFKGCHRTQDFGGGGQLPPALRTPLSEPTLKAKENPPNCTLPFLLKFPSLRVVMIHVDPLTVHNFSGIIYFRTSSKNKFFRPARRRNTRNRFLLLFQMVYPGHAKLSEKEKANVCYLAFPDSNSGCIGDTCFHFRMRRTTKMKQTRAAHTKYNQRCPLPLQIDSGYYFGFVYFRQVKDKRLPRGYLQKVGTVQQLRDTLGIIKLTTQVT